MKKIIIFFTLILSVNTIFAQKTGYVNMETILSQIPEYTTAQTELEQLASQFNAIIQKDLSRIEEKFKIYQQQKAQLTQRDRDSREAEIINDERALKEKQNSYFGEEGLMNKRSKELLDPIMERVNSMIEKYAKAKGYTLILDVASLMGVVYKDPAADISLEIIELL